MATNASFIPSSADLLMVVPRLARKLSGLVFAALPEHAIVGKLGDGPSVIADATGNHLVNTTAFNATSAFTHAAQRLAATTTAAAAAAAAAAATAATAATAAGADESGWLSYVTSPVSIDSFRSFGVMFSYLGSRWALTTFVIAILFNRTQFYASSRQNLSLKWRTRLLLYSAPILFLLLQLSSVLQALKCQTSPHYPLLRYKDASKRLPINFGSNGGFLHRLSTTLLFWKSDADCCYAMHMALLANPSLDVKGSYNIIWPVFLSLCLSQFIETLACAVQGRQIMPETGMTLFEHSLSFAECESMIASALGLDLFRPPTDSATSASPPPPLMTRSTVLKRLNAPPEVLLICLVSCLSHLSSAVLAVVGKRDQSRLVNTSIWAACYMAAFVWSVYHAATSHLDDEEFAILRFPTVCIVGFIPHILILGGISLCASIYAMALLVTAISLPPGMPTNPTIKERFRLAFDNLQANFQFTSASAIKLNWSEDFYTTILKVGFSVLTAASDAVYLNEGNRIHIHRMTWLEEKRLDELASRVEGRRTVANLPAELVNDGIASGLGFTDVDNPSVQSGFARERRPKPGAATAKSTNYDSGIGIAERRGRWQLTYQFFKGLHLLLIRAISRLLIGCLRAMGVMRIPDWLQHEAAYSRGISSNNDTPRRQRAETPDFWLVSDDGTLSIAENGNVDVELEMRRRLRAGGQGAEPSDEAVDADLYDWWKRGGWWGDMDKSGEYASGGINDDDDDDTTSMISMSSAASDVMFEDESGRRTPTQDDFGAYGREETPDDSLNMADLARLLEPKSIQDREEAQMLSRHLQSDHTMTRSQYRRRLNRDKARLLTGVMEEQTAHGLGHEMKSEAEEEAALEQFILERRTATGGDTGRGGSWDSGAEGMGSSGPQCVVCQSNPRVIMVWPCGCLSICDDCRVGVATRNFNNCMTCRTAVTAYSRLYVP